MNRYGEFENNDLREAEGYAPPDCEKCGDTGYAENSYDDCPACTPTEAAQVSIHETGGEDG